MLLRARRRPVLLRTRRRHLANRHRGHRGRGDRGRRRGNADDGAARDGARDERRLGHHGAGHLGRGRRGGHVGPVRRLVAHVARVAVEVRLALGVVRLARGRLGETGHEAGRGARRRVVALLLARTGLLEDRGHRRRVPNLKMWTPTTSRTWNKT